MGQLRRHSAVETLTSTAVGYAVSFIANAALLPLFGFSPNTLQNLSLTTVYTAISLIRGYSLRRLFNWLEDGR